MVQYPFVTFIILIAFVFDYTNGMHDSANSIATVVATRVLSPKYAVIWAAFFNFVAIFIVGTAVAKTIGKGMIDISFVTPLVIFCALFGAISWNILTWWLALPTSSSHALLGGYLGAAVANGGLQVVILSGWTKTLIFIFLAPLMGAALGFTLLILATWIGKNFSLTTMNRASRILQLLSSALYSIGHGANDAQKTMGIIVSLLLSVGLVTSAEPPIWVIIGAYTAIAAGTLTGGWRIVKTMGSKIVKLRPIDGFAAETASAISLFTASSLGVPVSTTHTITGAISGVGAAKNARAVKWGMTFRIVWAWIFTIPGSCAIAYGVFSIMSVYANQL
ncbi:inorganic phosphate transporter [Candidatus Gracilibacteria bacterium]|nr:inorganic phosphate transporter [Candidatus Gracilibacteria bacterium]